MMHDGYYYDGGTGMHWGAVFLVIIFVALLASALVLVAISLLRQRDHQRHHHDAPQMPPPPGEDARRMLDARLARGEIDEVEYTRLRDLLRSGD
jgi:uncharacterized membrane protein